MIGLGMTVQPVADSKDIPSRLEALRLRFINEATSNGMIDELDDIIAELKDHYLNQIRFKHPSTLHGYRRMIVNERKDIK